MHSVNRSQAVLKWRTPTVSMVNADRAKDPQYAARKVAKGQTITLADEVKTSEGGGQLNPAWVEWLMNWPLNWTRMEPLPERFFRAWLRASLSASIASKPSETDKSQAPPSSPGIPSLNGSTDRAA